MIAAGTEEYERDRWTGHEQCLAFTHSSAAGYSSRPLLAALAAHCRWSEDGRSETMALRPRMTQAGRCDERDHHRVGGGDSVVGNSCQSSVDDGWCHRGGLTCHNTTSTPLQAVTACPRCRADGITGLLMCTPVVGLSHPHCASPRGLQRYTVCGCECTVPHARSSQPAATATHPLHMTL